MSGPTSNLLSSEPAPAPFARNAGKGSLPKLDRYEALEKVGEGGMSTVYMGRHRVTGEIVALKILAPEVACKPILLKRFEQEFLTSSRLDHPNIVRSLDFGRHAQVPYLVMEFVDGMSLGEKIERGGRLPEAEAIRLIAQIAEGLDYAHGQGVIHRDVKPDNILLNKEGQAKLTDLGLVKEVENDMNLTRPDQGLGTPNFMSPEQFSSAKTIDLRCDVYGLGATLYQAVTGELPFDADSPIMVFRKKAFNELTPPRQLAPLLSEEAERAILRAMSKDPQDRQASAGEFIAELKGRTPRRATPIPAATLIPTVAALTSTPVEKLKPTIAAPRPVQAVKFTAPAKKPVPPAASAPSPDRPQPIYAVPKKGPAISEGWEWVLAGAIALGTGVAAFLAMNYLR